MQYIGEKIQELLKQKDLKQQALAKEMRYRPQHLSKKIGLKLSFSEEKVGIASRFLGVTPEYLRDESRPYYQGQPIPSDAILQPPAQAEVSDGDAIAALVKLAQEQMRHRKEVDSKIEPPPGAKEEVVGLLEKILEQMELLRADMNRILASAAMPGGEHDPD